MDQKYYKNDKGIAKLKWSGIILDTRAMGESHIIGHILANVLENSKENIFSQC